MNCWQLTLHWDALDGYTLLAIATLRLAVYDAEHGDDTAYHWLLTTGAHLLDLLPGEGRGALAAWVRSNGFDGKETGVEYARA